MRMRLSTRLWLAWIVLRGQLQSVSFGWDDHGWPERIAIDLTGEPARQYHHRIRRDNTP